MKIIKRLLAKNKLELLSDEEIKDLFTKLRNKENTELYSMTRMCLKYLQELIELNIYNLKFDENLLLGDIIRRTKGVSAQDAMMKQLRSNIRSLTYTIVMGTLLEEVGEEFKIGGPDDTGHFDFDEG
ncbi:hypothetical protein LCGC14_2626080 [marine sediment metagenome]|uniref:Uncharacterized protein n=1 Tax=marine sediment metagenome TaxID=412755 RepID=A0A0F9A1R0_9ZZZZ